MRRPAPVAVLGAGIMGSSTALHLARRGVPVTLFDREDAPFCGASRWSEGKIHLGFLYAGDPALASARSVLAGGLDFRRQVERLTGVSLEGHITPEDDVYVVHRDSVVAPREMAEYFDRLAKLIRGHPDAAGYLTDASKCRVEPLQAGELDGLADRSATLAGFRVPERSVDTNFLADAFVHAVEAEPGVEPALGQTVRAVEADSRGDWTVRTDTGRHGGYGAVVNALWEGRPAVDESMGHRPDTAPQHRHRVSLFVRTARDLDVTSAVVAVGPFGDMKNYDGRTFYLSWYPAGLQARAEAAVPPPTPLLADADRARIAAATFAGLGAILPAALEVQWAATDVRVEGGWVYSQGQGLLDDPGASVHRRARHGISRADAYFSVDTGKYSIAPTLAAELAAMVVATLEM